MKRSLIALFSASLLMAFSGASLAAGSGDQRLAQQKMAQQNAAAQAKAQAQAQKAIRATNKNNKAGSKNTQSF